LVTGFSAVFILEVCYFCTVRWRDAITDERQFKDKEDKGREEKDREDDDGVLWRTASDTNLTSAATVRWESPVLKHSDETNVSDEMKGNKIKSDEAKFILGNGEWNSRGQTSNWEERNSSERKIKNNHG